MASLFGPLVFAVWCSAGRGRCGRVFGSASITLQFCCTNHTSGLGRVAICGASTSGDCISPAAQRPELSTLIGPEKQCIPQSLSAFFQTLGGSRVYGSEAAQLSAMGTGGLSKHHGRERMQGLAASLEEGSDLCKESVPEERAVGASVTVAGPVKNCIECQRTKLVCDFKETPSSPDGRSPTCRACLAVLRPQRRKRPLLHLGLTPEEAWERAKECKSCGVKKELRDFQVASANKDGTQNSCRSCVSAAQARAPLRERSDSPQQCRSCNIVKPASSFGAVAKSPNGLNPVCKPCVVMEKQQRVLTLKQFGRLQIPKTQRTNKICQRCGQLKSPSEFYDDWLNHDCLSSYCKACIISSALKHQAAKKGLRGLSDE